MLFNLNYFQGGDLLEDGRYAFPEHIGRGWTCVSFL